MPRQARIDIPGLLQHVIIRGVAQADIFEDDKDRHDFVRRLAALLGETGTLCYGWALLDNHAHLLLLPTRQPLASLMRRLLTGYAVSFNLRHKRAGHLFQNRYKSIVCDDEAYRLELLRYIHLNPLRAGIATNLDELARYPWSGHRQMIGEAEYPLLATTELLPLFAKRKKAAAKRYLQFLEDGLRLDQTTSLSRGGRRASQAYNSKLQDDEPYDERILGGGDFVEQVLGADKAPTSLPLSPTEVISRVADYYHLRAEEMDQPCRRPLTVQAKAVICYLATRRMQLPGAAIATQLGYTASAVSKASYRGEKLIQADKELRAFIEFIVSSRTSR
jgi:REP element-mobilizing transposase RayT